MTLRLLPVLFLLTACGVDGAPVRPSDVKDKPQSAVILSGSVEVGIARTD